MYFVPQEISEPSEFLETEFTIFIDHPPPRVPANLDATLHETGFPSGSAVKILPAM